MLYSSIGNVYFLLQTNLSDSMKKPIQPNSFFVQCLSCGSKTKECQSVKKKVYESECSASSCNFVESNVNVDCDVNVGSEKCRGTVIFRSGGEGHCLSCEESFEQAYLQDALLSSMARSEDRFGNEYWGNCSECRSDLSLVRTDNTGNDEWICTNCIQAFGSESLSKCIRCGYFNTGDMDESGYAGCSYCSDRE